MRTVVNVLRDRLKRSAKSLQERKVSREALGLLAVAMLSVGLRFWHISRFNDLVFDEVYFVKFAQAYLEGAPQFDAHPPLGKYLIAVGIWLNAHGAALFPFFTHIFKSHTTAAVGIPPFGYRWMTAAVGSCVPMVVFGIAYALGQDQSRAQRLMFAVLSGGFVAIDGLFVTESRYALINIYMVLFGLLGHYLWLQADLCLQREQRLKQVTYRLLAGVALGCAIATKWNGLGFLLSLVVYALCQKRKQPIRLFIYVGLVPAIAYSLIWLPHLQITGESLRSLHTTLFTFHQQLPADGHPACSKWYSWPLLLKPITYWYKDAGDQVFTVSNLGNPALWWLSSAAVFLLFVEKSNYFRKYLKDFRDRYLGDKSNRPKPLALDSASSKRNNLEVYLLIGYGANWLPWIAIGRCTFIYLYMPAAVFSFMTLAWLMSQWLHSSAVSVRAGGLVMLSGIAIAFIYWLPLALGSALTPNGLQSRWWLSIWI